MHIKEMKFNQKKGSKKTWMSSLVKSQGKDTKGGDNL